MQTLASDRVETQRRTDSEDGLSGGDHEFDPRFIPGHPTCQFPNNGGPPRSNTTYFFLAVMSPQDALDGKYLGCLSKGVACMLPLVNVAAILRGARVGAGLSRRALAAKARVPTSTVSRIEEGLSDPSLGMLDRLVSATGSDLVVEWRPREDRLSLAELATAWNDHSGRVRVDWTRLRAFVDRIQQDPSALPEAIADPPAPTYPLLNAILAALADQLADEYEVERPRWTRAFGPLEEPWAPPATPRMRASFEQSTPEAFRRRNLVLSRSALFRTAT